MKGRDMNEGEDMGTVEELSSEECRSKCAAISGFVLLRFGKGLALLYDEQSIL